MDLSIQKLTKHFNQQKVFEDLSFEVISGSRWAITGPNGSGKSTLLKIISGGALPTSGIITYQYNNAGIDIDSLYQYVHFVAPYNTVIEELTLPELFEHHQRLGLLKAFKQYQSWVSQLEYNFDPDRQIKAFSSGMKQRVKLGLTLLDNRPLILLDEPGSNLDTAGREWMFQCINNVQPYQTVIIATNDPSEIDLCSKVVSVAKKTA